MRKVSIFAIFINLSITSMLLTPSLSYAGTSGASCPTLGKKLVVTNRSSDKKVSSSKEFTCIKKAGRLIWNNGKKIAPPQTTGIEPGLESGGFNRTSCSFNGKKLYGRVYFTKYSFDSDFKVYVSDYSFDSDLKVFLTDYSFDANSCGKWYPTKYSFDADFRVYLTSYSFDADFKIYETDYSFDAGR